MADLKAAMMAGVENPMMRNAGEGEAGGDEDYDDFASVVDTEGGMEGASGGSSFDPGTGARPKLFRPASKREMQWRQKEQSRRAGKAKRTSKIISRVSHLWGSKQSSEDDSQEVNHIGEIHRGRGLSGEGGGRARGVSTSGIGVGVMVRMHGLRKVREYNGAIARVMSYQPHRHRWLVKAWGDGRSISLGPEHLTPITLMRPAREAPQAPAVGGSKTGLRTKLGARAADGAAGGEEDDQPRKRAPTLDVFVGGINKAVERSRRNLRKGNRSPKGREKQAHEDEASSSKPGNEGDSVKRAAHISQFKAFKSKRVLKKVNENGNKKFNETGKSFRVHQLDRGDSKRTQVGAALGAPSAPIKSRDGAGGTVSDTTNETAGGDGDARHSFSTDGHLGAISPMHQQEGQV
jgi:hypothetical protein